MNTFFKKITYSNPPKYDKPEKYRDYIAKNSDYSCAYCSLMESENLGATFNIDHFKPKALFPLLYAECENLRYSCPRCNSYKRAKWITIEQGCRRKCTSCTNRVCKDDIPRFIDCLEEDPNEIFEVSSDFKLLVKNNSKVAQYTIDALRLNRVQLIKMRYARVELNKIYQDIKTMKNMLKLRKDGIISLKTFFDKLKENASEDVDLIDTIGTLFEMILLCIDHEETFVKHIEDKIFKIYNPPLFVEY